MAGETVSLAGTVESQVQADLGFRIGGRLLERLVSVGDAVTAGQVMARLDPADEENGLRAAEANLAAAEAQLSEARVELRPPAPALRPGLPGPRGSGTRRGGADHGARRPPTRRARSTASPSGG